MSVNEIKLVKVKKKIVDFPSHGTLFSNNGMKHFGEGYSGLWSISLQTTVCEFVK